MIRARRSLDDASRPYAIHCRQQSGAADSTYSARRVLEESAEDDGGVFAESAIFGAEGGGKV